MPYIVRDVGQFVTSSNGTVTNILGHFDDASSIIVMVASSAAQLSSGNTLKVSMWDFADSTGGRTTVGVTFSTAFYTYNQYTTGTTPTLSSGNAFTIPNVAFRSVRMQVLASGTNTDGEIVAWVLKQITV